MTQKYTPLAYEMKGDRWHPYVEWSVSCKHWHYGAWPKDVVMAASVGCRGVRSRARAEKRARKRAYEMNAYEAEKRAKEGIIWIDPYDPSWAEY